MARYAYDPWGRVLSVTGSNTSIGNLNPLRYRGYYYDTETGFYYLQSRYYDPAICRFINADSYVTTSITDLLSTNMFAYCENNPVNSIDFLGTYTFLCRELEQGRQKTTTADILVSAIITALFKSIEADVGFGMGIGGTAEFVGVGINAGYYHNFLELYLDDGNMGLRQSETNVAGVTIPMFTFGYRQTYYYDLRWNHIGSSYDNYKYVGTNLSTGLSLATYLGYGFSASISINWVDFFENVEKEI